MNTLLYHPVYTSPYTNESFTCFTPTKLIQLVSVNPETRHHPIINPFKTGKTISLQVDLTDYSIFSNTITLTKLSSNASWRRAAGWALDRRQAILLTHWGRDEKAAIFQTVFSNALFWVQLKKVRIDSIPALVQIMTWCIASAKPLSGPMIVWLSTHICVTRPQWVNWYRLEYQVLGSTSIPARLDTLIYWELFSWLTRVGTTETQ